MSSPSNKAANEASRAEKQRQASIANTQSSVNRVFNDPRRQGEISDFVNATREFYGQDLGRQKTQSDRELKFALTRNGVMGGSTQVDQQRRLGEDYQRGLLDVDRRARAAGADLETADQEARARLISLATSGLDATTAARQASESMRVGLESAKASATASGLGDVFTGMKPFVQNARDSAERRRANRDAGWELYQPSAATAFNYGGGS